MSAANSFAICRLAELADPGTRAFAIGSGDWPLKGFLVRVGDRVFAYVNRCPHAGHPLNFRPDEFLAPDQRSILCRSHGALFEPTTGACVAGPCAGRSLHALCARVEAGLVIIDADRELEEQV